jgi:hypothetical protein
LTKYACLHLEQYDKVCLLDVDVIVLRNMDDIFQIQAPAGSFDNYWLQHNSVYPVSEDSTPGGTVYLFHPYTPLELPLLWFWKCVVVARDTREVIKTNQGGNILSKSV